LIDNLAELSWRVKSASFLFIRRFRQSNRNSKGSKKKIQRGGGVNKFEILKAWGGGGGGSILVLGKGGKG